MTTYFDNLQGWLRDLEQAESNPAPLITRAKRIVARSIFMLDAAALERLGWAHYITQGDLIERADVAAVQVVQAIEAKLRRDLRYLDAAIYAMTGRPAQGFPHLWTSHPPHEGDIPEDLAPAAQRVGRLCSHAHDLMHTVAATYGLSDNPATAAEQAMDREGGRL